MRVLLAGKLVAAGLLLWAFVICAAGVAGRHVTVFTDPAGLFVEYDCRPHVVHELDDGRPPIRSNQCFYLVTATPPFVEAWQ